MCFALTRRWVIFFLASSLFVLSQFYRASIAVITPRFNKGTYPLTPMG